MSLENLKQEPKSAIDINQAMNGLLTSIAEVVSAKTPTISQLSNIRNILINIREANKDLNFVIAPETTVAIQKTLSSVTLPDVKTETKVDISLPSIVTSNSKINQTIESISNVISLMLAAEKTPQNIPATQRLDKALIEVLVTLLGSGLKQFAAVNIPKDIADKNTINVNLAGNKDVKLGDAITKIAVDATAKNSDVVAAPKNVTSKQVFGIGQLPDFFQKNQDQVVVLPPKADKNSDELANIDANKTVKGEDDFNYKTILPTTKNDVQLQDINLLLANEGKTTTDASTSIYNATRPENKTTDDVPNSSIKIEKTDPAELGATDITTKAQHNITNLATGAQKPITPTNWYAKSVIGDALSFFGVTSADVALFAAKAIRDFNTVVNAETLSLAMQNPFKSLFLGQNQDGGKSDVATENTNISLRILEMSAPEEKPLTTFQQQDAAIDFPNVDSSIFKQRTFSIIGTGNGTGFLKIYLNRGPKFSDSQSVTQLIPFQFEPVISGDAKAAEYSQISTLARSQAAQVYRKSQERTITLQLDYLVAQPAQGDNSYVNTARSASAADMTAWTEDYIYNYIVRNLKNLILPNIVNTNFKLAPPIVQVWYGGINSTQGSSTGEGITIQFGAKTPLQDVHPTFRTNWFTYDGGTGNYAYRSFRSLWVVQNVSFEYKGGIVNSTTRRNIQVTASLSLIEIAPSATDNELVIWNAASGNALDPSATPNQYYSH